MAIAFDTSDSLAWSSTATSKSVDITAAATNSWVYVSLLLWTPQSSQTAAITFTGWTKVLENEAHPGSFGHYAVYKRQKVGGDTTFTLSWDTTSVGEYTWGSYSGVATTTPDEQATFNAGSASTSVATSSLTPTTSNCWALMFVLINSSTTTHRTISAAAGLTEREDTGENTRGTSSELADSNGTVTVAAHSYTATASSSLATAPDSGGAILLFLRPTDDTPLGFLPVGF